MENVTDPIVELEWSGIEYVLEIIDWVIDLEDDRDVVLEWLDYPQYRES